MVTYQFTVDLEIPESEERLYVRVLKRDEPEAFASTCFAVQHDCRIDHFPELGKELAH